MTAVFDVETAIDEQTLLELQPPCEIDDCPGEPATWIRRGSCGCLDLLGDRCHNYYITGGERGLTVYCERHCIRNVTLRWEKLK